MVLLGKRRRNVVDDLAAGDGDKLVATSWTQGQWIRATAAKVALWAMVASAPAALVLAGMAQSRAHQPIEVAAASTPEPEGKQAAAAVALNAVVTWLGADRSAQKIVKAAGLPAVQLPEKGLDVSDPSVVDARWIDHIWLITIGVTVNSSHPGEGGAEGTKVVQRRYFQIPAQVGPDDEITLLSLPAEVAAPDANPGEANGYATAITESEPIALAVSEFANALLAGTGDITRYTAPESTIQAVSPAPYSVVKLVSLTADEAPSSAEGAEANVSARLRATTESTSTDTTFDYFLALKLRSGRWEVAAIQAAPANDTTPSAPTPEPVPTASASE